MRRSSAALIVAGALLGCGESDWPDRPVALSVRLEVEDPGAAFVSYRVWDERHELVRDAILPASDFPRVLALTPDGSDPTSRVYRGARVELETWTAELCPRGRASLGLRYEVSEDRQTLRVGAPAVEASCTPLFVDGASEAPDATCTREAPCRALAEAMVLARAASGRFVLHIAGGSDYAPLESQGGLRGQDPAAPNIVRAWPGRALPEAPALFPKEPLSCAGDPSPCNGNSICIDGRCAAEPPISLCCDFDESGPANLEVDGLTIRRGKWGIEVNGGRNITIRHCTVEDAGGAFPQRSDVSAGGLPSGGMRIFRSPGTLVEHNRIRRSVDLSGRSFRPAVGILVDGVRADTMETAVLLRGNRVEGSQDAGLFVVDPDGPVELSGNVWCDNGGSGMLFYEGRRDIVAEHELLSGNGSVDIRNEAYAGTIRLSHLTSTSSESLAGVEEVDASLLRGEVPGDNRGDNLVDPDPPADVQSCLAGQAHPAYGVCATFPDC